MPGVSSGIAARVVIMCGEEILQSVSGLAWIRRIACACVRRPGNGICQRSMGLWNAFLLLLLDVDGSGVCAKQGDC